MKRCWIRCPLAGRGTDRYVGQPETLGGGQGSLLREEEMEAGA